jgi:hypothetical protein
MKRFFCVVSLAVLLCFTFTCQKAGKGAAKEPEASVDADVAAIKALYDEWAQIYNKGDFERLISIFAEEKTLFFFGIKRPASLPMNMWIAM